LEEREKNVSQEVTGLRAGNSLNGIFFGLISIVFNN